MSASWVQAQEVLVSLEAEDGIITLPAKVKPVDGSTVARLSGGKYIDELTLHVVRAVELQRTRHVGLGLDPQLHPGREEQARSGDGRQ